MPRSKKPRRRGRLIVITVVMLLVAGLSYGGYWGVSTVSASFPQVDGEIAIEGMDSSVTVKRDSNGISQLYADTSDDLFMAQGYVHAQDRFYEMDVRRHTAAGRLSEMFGEDTVESDAFLRTLGMYETAEEEYENELSASTKRYLRAYAKGVNAYLATHSGAELSVEYAILGFENDYTPEKWTPVDSLAWLKVMAWELSGNLQEEIDRALMSQRLTEEEIDELYPEYDYDRNSPIVTEQGNGTETYSSSYDTLSSLSEDDSDEVVSQLSGLSDTLEQIPDLLGDSSSGIGSNSWVVSGEYTTTGEALMANDTHLDASVPSVWYQMGLHCNEVTEECPYDVSGYTFSGMPGVVIGHNQDISWGMTNMDADVTDLRLEKLDDGKYLRDGEWVRYETRTETIKVAGGESRKITVRSTANGPIISDRSSELSDVGSSSPVDADAPDRGSGYAVSLNWTALTPGNTMDAVFELNKASDFDEFRAAAQDFDVPSQNLIYADTSGNIGYQAPGQIPIRGQGDGDYPSPGWDSSYDWTSYIPQDELPWELNPEKGYIVTANQAVIDPDEYDYHLTSDWSYGTRSNRIEELIQDTISDGGKISMRDMQEIQLDNYSEIAEILVPYLLDIDIDDPYIKEAQDLLRGWDYSQDSDSPAAAYFNAVWRNLLQLAFGDKLPKELRVEGECLTVRPADDSEPIEDSNGNTRLIEECGERSSDTAQPDGGDRWSEVVRNIIDEPENHWWQAEATDDQPAADNRDEVLRRALRDARYELTAELGKDTDTWSWGRLHELTLENQTLGTSDNDVVEYLLNRGPYNISGGTDAVDASSWNAAAGYEITSVPTMRMIVSLADFDDSQWINLTGASGHAYHPNYTDQTELWAKGEYLTWRYSDKAVDAATEHTLTLTPEDTS